MGLESGNLRNTQNGGDILERLEGVERKKEIKEGELTPPDTTSGVSGGAPQNRGIQEMEVNRLRAEAMSAASSQVVPETPTPFVPYQKSEAVPEKSFKNKILSFFGQAPEQLQSKYSGLGEERMSTNRALKDQYEKYKMESESIAESYKEALGKWRYVGRDEKGNFVDKTVYGNKEFSGNIEK